MKLRELLKVIPDEYEIGIAGSDKNIYTITYGNQEEAIMGFAKSSTYTKEQIEDMEVIAIYPCTNVSCKELHMYADDITPLHIKTQLIIRV